jgi:dihydroceramidase
VGLRAAVAVAEVAAEAHALGAGGPLLAVTHSTVLEAFLATLFGADFDSVETETLAWLKLRVVPYRLGPTVGWRLVIEDSRGIAWRRSPDALVLDSTAAAFAGAAPGFVLSNGGASGAARSPWMLRVLVGSLLMAVAGVLRILATGGKVGGNAEAVDVASYWGPVTGSIDWCEANYAVHPRIAEFANSLTSLFFVAAGLHVANSSRGAGAEVRYQLLGVFLALVGVGSTAFHATLRKQEQALDEIPMLWLATLAAYCVFQGGRAANKPSTATAATTHAPGAYLPPLPEASPLPPPHGPWLPALLLAWCGVATAAQWRVSSGWQPLAFHLGFASAEAVFLRGAWLQKRRAKDPRTKAVLDRAFALYALAIGTWALDNAFCQALRRVSSSVTWGWVAYPQLHAWGWHGVMSLASALMILGGTAERLELLASAPGHRAWLQPSPRFGFFWPTLRHANTATRPALK